MDSFKLSTLLIILILTISSSTPLLACGSCGTSPKPSPKPPVTPPPVLPKPPITLPPVLPKPPITLPPVLPKPPITLPPVLPKPPVVLPPVLPPVIEKPPTPKPCPSPAPAKKVKCPINTLKFGGCVNLLGGLGSIVIGDPVSSECCPLVQGLTDLEAAVCLCTTIKLKLLNVKLILPIAFKLLITCGKTPPPGFDCP